MNNALPSWPTPCRTAHPVFVAESSADSACSGGQVGGWDAEHARYSKVNLAAQGLSVAARANKDRGKVLARWTCASVGTVIA
jgi:hypothetical protein